MTFKLTCKKFMMSEIDCYVCKNETALGDSFRCEGTCSRRMHAKCVGVNKTVLKTYIEMDNLFYMCDVCIKSSMKAINTKLDNIMNIITVYDERVIRYEKNMTELKDCVKELKECVNSKTDTVSDALSKMNNQCAQKVKPSYADKVKQSEPVVLVVPRRTQTTQETQKDVRQLMDPSEIPIDSMRNASKGTVVLEGRSKNDLDLIQKYASEKLGSTYDVKLSELKRPKILVSGMSEKFSNDEIISKLKVQNRTVEDAELRVVSTFGKSTFNAVIEMDCDSFNKVMSNDRRKLNIGWSSCIVKEYVDLMKCYNCQGFNHTAKACTRKKACKKCAGEHDVAACKSTVIRCTNCNNANKRLNLNLRTDHVAGSDNCKVTERQMNINRKRVQYKMNE